jgi:peptidoglycan/LPS O-acetylase OafA/YrhL
LNQSLYIREFDGLRGLLALVVLIFHAHLGIMKGGFLAVDMFFCLSGFLITRNLINQWEYTESIDYWQFQRARQKRLLPAYLFFLACWLMIDQFFHQTAFYEVIKTSGIYAMNWQRAWLKPYPIDLGHTWSLCVEAQFYALYPLVLSLFLRMYRSKVNCSRLLNFFIFSILLSWTQRIYLISTIHEKLAMIERVYNGLDTNLDTLMAGACSAVIYRYELFKIGRQGFQGLTLTFILAVIWCRFNATFYLAFGHTLVALLCSLFLLAIAQNTGKRSLKWLREARLVKLGTWSYSFYLWHYPILHWLKPLDLSAYPRCFLAFLLTLVAAKCSFEIIEKRFHRRLFFVKS